MRPRERVIFGGSDRPLSAIVAITLSIASLAMEMMETMSTGRRLRVVEIRRKGLFNGRRVAGGVRRERAASEVRVRCTLAVGCDGQAAITSYYTCSFI